MAETLSSMIMSSIFFFLLCCTTTTIMAASNSINILHYGAKPDGRTDAAKALLSAWAAACGSRSPVNIYIPAGLFFVSGALFQGPCRRSPVKIYMDGTLVAPASYGGSNAQTGWLRFQYVYGLSIFGGTIDGRGQALWDCKKSGRRCPGGAISLEFNQVRDVLVDGLTSLNSETFHMSIFGSTGVHVQGGTFAAPADSPNTDGIHIQLSSFVTVSSANFSTGDDCISMGDGSTSVWIEHINCGPGHGISIGSLGGTPKQVGVANITVLSAVFTGTQNGLRIKTWANPYVGFVRKVRFEHVVMQNVQNPIVIDQNYCPSHVNCPTQGSGIKIKGVTYNNIRGTSATPVAVKFDCSPRAPCSQIDLQDVILTYGQKGRAQAYCKNAYGSVKGPVTPTCIIT